MKKYLVIVESPAKAKTIQKFLGKDYEVKASMGHVRDLPKNGLGIDIENNFKPHYVIIPSRVSLINELKKYIPKVKKVFLATDLDREGEAISWHLKQALEIPNEKTARVIFNEITKNAIVSAFKSPLEIQMSKVYAQQARRILDRIVGYKLSPLLWEKITKGLSAGRVQSVAVKLVVEKEKSIKEFKSKEYWKITARLYPSNLGDDEIKKIKEKEKSDKNYKSKYLIEAELKKKDDKKVEIPNKEEALKIVEFLKDKDFIVYKITRKKKKVAPSPPFTTSQLQQQASTHLNFKTKYTMSLAQQLYEGIDIGEGKRVGLITYMRTDSIEVSAEAIKECRNFIKSNVGEDYLPTKPRNFKNPKKAQGAHEAIRPTSVFRTPEDMKPYLSLDQYKLYKLIWERFIASQVKDAEVCLTTLLIKAKNYLFEVKGKEILFLGHYKIIPLKSSEGEKILPELNKGDKLKLDKLVPSQHFTQPPPRYTEATLVKTLESKGIGRPSTYAPIITTIQERGYVRLENKKFYATELGIKVTEELNTYFPDIMDYGFTSGMESKLDLIEDNKIEWVVVVRDFYKIFEKDLKKAYENMKSLKKNPEVSPYKCEKCGSPMVYKYNKNGKFLGCSSFPKCKFTMALDKDGNPIVLEKTEYKCEKCGAFMVIRNSKRGRFLGCSNYPKCKFTMSLDEENKPIVLEETDEICPKCKGKLVKRVGVYGEFLACSNYPECDYTKSLHSVSSEDVIKFVNKKCSKCGSPLTIKKGSKGFFLGCTGYPNCKNIEKFSVDIFKFPDDWKPPVCPQCNEELVVKHSRNGIFWGCKNYPKCKHIQPCNLYELISICMKK